MKKKRLKKKRNTDRRKQLDTELGRRTKVKCGNCCHDPRLG